MTLYVSIDSSTHLRRHSLLVMLVDLGLLGVRPAILVLGRLLMHCPRVAEGVEKSAIQRTP